MAEWVYINAPASFVSNFVLFPLFYPEKNPERNSWTKIEKEKSEN